MNEFTDIHMHLVPGVDDGCRDLEMSMQMISLAREEGIRTIFATPHIGQNFPFPSAPEWIDRQFLLLKERAMALYPDMRILRGNEIYYEEDTIQHWLIKDRACTMADSNYVLIEFGLASTAGKIERALLSLRDMGWWPILAHAERYPAFHGHITHLKELVERGIYLQINAYSLHEEKDGMKKQNARWLALEQLAHFIGSDAHRPDHRPPSMRSGVDYLLTHCDRAYAEDLVDKNAERVIENVKV